MDNRNDRVGWSDAQWNRVRQVVTEEFQRASVVRSFLPIFGPLPRSTEVVPSERMRDAGTVLDRDLLDRGAAPAGYARDRPRNSGEPPNDEQMRLADQVATAILGIRGLNAGAAQANRDAVAVLRDALAQLVTIATDPRALSVRGGANARLAEISGLVRLTRQQLAEEDLSSAMQVFRRAANRLARLEDWVVLNGQVRYQQAGGDSPKPHRPTDLPAGYQILPGEAPTADEWNDRVFERLSANNPGGLGLLGAAGYQLPERAVVADMIGARARNRPAQNPLQLTGLTLITALVQAISHLEDKGYVAPFACVLGTGPFVTAHTPTAGSLIMPRDRIEPLLKRELIRSGVLNDSLREEGGQWGIVLSLSGEPIDLAVAVDVTPEFLFTDDEGRSVFRVFERFAPRVKDPDAIVRLRFT